MPLAWPDTSEGLLEGTLNEFKMILTVEHIAIDEIGWRTEYGADYGFLRIS